MSAFFAISKQKLTGALTDKSDLVQVVFKIIVS